MAQVVECLPSKHKALSSNSNTAQTNTHFFSAIFWFGLVNSGTILPPSQMGINKYASIENSDSFLVHEEN
jgi:hypothetical protein